MVLAVLAGAAARGDAAEKTSNGTAEPAVKPVTGKVAERPTAGAAAPRQRFFRHGDGMLHLENAHTHEKVVVRFRNPDGTYVAPALDKIDALFRSRGDDAQTRVSLRLLEMIDYLEDEERPQQLLLVSGYRSEGYNDALIAKGGQAARTSMHSEGLAADLRFVGVDQRALWDRLRALECCGAGYYQKNGFVHVDTGKPRFWEESTSKVKENLSKGNARVIARTDYDRYGDLVGMEATLHAITLHPLKIANRAKLVAQDDGREIAALELVAGHAEASDGDCIVVDGSSAGARERLRVTSVVPLAPGTPDAPPRIDEDVAIRARVALTTCEPRLEATPERIETNPIETSAAALDARRGTGG
ncbi:DUF882 domain-containing protein [Candidatus Binatia bacterium]|nr:DUF882 domain-containing protein [Candidatus Binatia bacterium]